MERVTLRIEKQNLEDLDSLVEEGEYPNRSEAVRDGIRTLLDEYSNEYDSIHDSRTRVMTDGSGEVDHELDFEEMTTDDWEEYLQDHPHRLVVNAKDGTHSIEWDDLDDQLTFYAYGSAGYDYDGSRAALEEVAEQSNGLSLVPKPVADGGEH
jgi:Arc/MetJ-type ribon-helix-helix transcriptional regulator